MTSTNLKNRSVTAFLWGGGGSFIKLVIQIGAQIILARILGPEQYGLFAIGVIVISFSNFFSDVGIAYGLIQRENVTDEHIRYIFTWQLILGAVVSLAVAGFSGHLADFFNETRAESILLALAPICFIQAAGAVSLNLLKRQLDFKTLQFAQTGGYVLGYIGVGIPLAMAGWQIWALIAAWGVQVVATTVWLYWRVRHSIKPLIHHVDGREISGFGAKVLATNLTNWVIGNIDRVVIARHFPTASIGLYATPYNLMYTPSATLMGVVQPVMYAACARVQGESIRIGKAYITLVAAITLGVMPIFVAVSAVSETFILALYGQAWIGAAEVLQPIALAMPLFLLWNITTPPLWTNGQPGLEFKMQIPLAILWLLASLVAVKYSLAAVAWTVFGLFLIRCGVFIYAASKITGVLMKEYLRVARGGVAMSALVGLAAWFLDQSGYLLGIESALLLLVVVIVGCAVTALMALKLFPGLVSLELTELIQQNITRMPNKLAVVTKWFFSGVKQK